MMRVHIVPPLIALMCFALAPGGCRHSVDAGKDAAAGSGEDGGTGGTGGTGTAGRGGTGAVGGSGTGGAASGTGGRGGAGGGGGSGGSGGSAGRGGSGGSGGGAAGAGPDAAAGGGPGAGVPLRVTLVGDLHSRAQSEANLRNARDSSDLIVLLGDLAYARDSSPADVQAYCALVKRNVGNVPVLVMPGDHDDLERGDQTNGIDIRKLLPCLPPLPSGELATAPAGDYPYRYQVGLRGGTTLIVTGGIGLATGIPEHVKFADMGWHNSRYASGYNWSAGTANYMWLSDAIDRAWAGGARHIIVANHEPCLDVSDTTYDRNRGNCTDVMNLLIAKRVDMFVHGSKHQYVRSKLLAHSAACPRLIMPANNSGANPDPACAKEALNGSVYPKGGGLLHLTVGTGGADSYDCAAGIAAKDKELPLVYLNTCTKDFGIAIVTITSTAIRGVFKRDNGTIGDMFSIEPPL